MKHLYLSTSHDLDSRVQDLPGKMTLEEKVAQTGFVHGSKLLENGELSLELVKEHCESHGIGGVMDPWLAATENAKVINSIQKYMITQTRLGIPALIMGECLHGHLSPGATIFPQAIALSSS
ncbi:MAG: hypothetical protein KAS17_07935 [Victivallaceae bacterium]|nr:hypothetical protein [Victivallaceae bacterium]